MGANSAAQSRVVRVLAWAGGALVLWALVGFLAAPPLLRPVLERKLSETLHRKVEVRRLALNPFTLSATLRNVSIRERSAPETFLSFESLHVNLEAVSLLRGGPVIREVELTSPRVSLVRYDDGTYNVSDLIDELGKEEPGKKPSRFSVNNIRVTGGAIDLDDRPKKTKHEVRDLRLGIPFLSNIPSKVEIFTKPSLSANVNGALFALNGKTKPFSSSRETLVDLDLTDVDLPRYLSYLPAKLPVQLAAGRLDAKVTLDFEESPGRPNSLVLTGSASLRDGSLVQRDKPLFSVRRLDAAFSSYDVFAGVLKLASLTADSPDLHVRRDRKGDFEIVSAFSAGGGPAPGARRKAAPNAKPASFAYEIGEVRVENGTIEYADASLGKPFETKLAPVAISLRGFSSKPGGKPAALSFTAKSDAGETLKHEGTFTLQPVSAEGSVQLTGVPLKRYAPFYEKTLLADLEGTLDLGGRYKLTGGVNGDTTVTGLSAGLHALKARKRRAAEPFLAVPAATLEGGEMDLARRSLALGSLSTRGGFLAVRREADGSIDVLKLTGGSPAETANGGAGDPPQPAGKAVSPWRLSVRKLSVDAYTLKIDDLAPGKPAHLVLSPTNVLLENFATSGPEHGSLSASFTLGKKGLATANGPVGISPVYADLKVGVKNLDLVPLEPYILSQIKLSLTRGTLNGSGTLSFRPGPAGAASVTFSGNAAARKVVAVEEKSKEDFLRWDSVSVDRLKAGYNPVFVSARKLDASGVVCHIGISEDGTVNLRAILGSPEKAEQGESADEAPSAAPEPAPKAEAAPAPAPTAPPTPIRVDAVTLRDSTIRLTDHLVKPRFSAELGNVGGSIQGLSSVDGTKADVDLHGTWAGASPLEISGTVNPLAASLHAALKASFRDIDLVPMTPYFGKYAGYAVARGKLTMTVEYRIENRKLEAKNKLVVDQFAFGDKMESSTATKLPVRLAVSLLKDRNGVIDLDLPISGSLDDPKFKLGSIIWKVLGNLISKAVTSPFSLLGKLFGGGQELSAVEFDAGRDTLTPASRQRLDALATALHERPALKLEAQGRIDPGNDAEGLRRARFERKVKAQKMDELLKKGAAPPSLDDVVVSAEEWPAVLKKAYKKEKFKKPRTALGFAKDLPPEEMEKLMLANLTVAPEDLRQLALSRAEAVRSYLLATGKVDSDRIFLVEPGKGPAEKKENLKESRVDFVLK